MANSKEKINYLEHNDELMIKKGDKWKFLTEKSENGAGKTARWKKLVNYWGCGLHEKGVYLYRS